MDIVINANSVSIPEGKTPIQTQGHYVQNILACLDYPLDAPPLAELLRQFHELEGEGQWFIASPIHWQATHNDAMIIASGEELELCDDASRRWFEAFTNFIATEGMQLHYHDAYTWLLRAPEKPEILAKPAYAMHHQSLMPVLQNLDGTLFWQRFLTENQMFFNTHPLNNERTGPYSINGVWIWGGGRLHAPVQSPIVCDGLVDSRLAHLLSTNVTAYQSIRSFSKNQILLFHALDKQTQHHLELHTQQYRVRWYWNNLAYESPPKNWLLRMLSHAN